LKLEAPVIAKLEKITGLDVIADGLNKVLDAYEKRVSEITARNIRQTQALASLEAEQKQFQAASAAFWQEPLRPVQAGGGVTQATADKIRAAREQMAAAVMDMDRLGQSTTITDQDMAKVAEDATKIKEALSTALPGLGSMMERARIAEEVDKMVDALKRMQEFQRQAQENAAKAGEPSKAEVDAIQQQIDALNKKRAAEAEAAKQTERGKTAALETTGAIDAQLGSIQRDIDAAGQLAAAWQNVAQAAAAAAQAAAAASMPGAGGGFTDASGFEGGLDFFGPELAAMGGLMRRLALGGLARHFDRGGFARRGTDVIPAMLAPGEFVMSAQATRRFYSQLVAMNAGIAPSFRSRGGLSTSVTVGDIYINEAAEPRQTAREVISRIKRELRRGTSEW
jgi:hypothetical protein